MNSEEGNVRRDAGPTPLQRSDGTRLPPRGGEGGGDSTRPFGERKRTALIAVTMDLETETPKGPPSVRTGRLTPRTATLW